jgi:hypothetical protein
LASTLSLQLLVNIGVKSETRISKSEAISNDPNSNVQNPVSFDKGEHKRQFEAVFVIWISIFVFVSSFGFCASNFRHHWIFLQNSVVVLDIRNSTSFPVKSNVCPVFPLIWLPETSRIFVVGNNSHLTLF